MTLIKVGVIICRRGSNMPTIGELRRLQDEHVERLRKLQRDKAIAPGERKEAIQKEIDAVLTEIAKLDTVIQSSLNESRVKR
jgi:hypothetical protein